MITPNQLNWWIDASGILHACSKTIAPPAQTQNQPQQDQKLYAQGLIDPVAHSGSITHIDGQPATLASIPREIFDVLDKRFPHTRWWVIDPTHDDAQTDSPPSVQVPAHY